MILLLVLLTLTVLITLALVLYFRLAPRIGGDPTGDRLARIRALSNFRDGRLHNLEPTDMNMPFTTMLKVMWTMLRGSKGREPERAIPVVSFDREAWERIPDHEVGIAWFGHSCVLLKIDGITFLTDPVFGERASTFTFAGPKRFAYTEHMRVSMLPPVDVVLLSHDHYDHLCYETIYGLVVLRMSGAAHDRPNRKLRFITALGVGAHLEKWGVDPARITELAWWQQAEVGPVKVTLTPTRHFTGRGLTNRFSTLWGAFALQGARKRIFFGADSGYTATFKEVGERFGPFDLALLECGAYSEHWAQIHMFPEETAQAALDLKARVLMPIHWGKFALGLHPWKEPIERIHQVPEHARPPLLTPRIGGILAAIDPARSERWWEPLA
ncbi:MAG: MBL fold metallo-hydrolase [Flavobacteriales bacterium]|nr:MBL fold metallo-hydrolase [Flavobacteriales bacterium]